MQLGVIGCGKMGTALIQGIINAKILTPSQVHGYDTHAGTLTAFTTATLAHPAPDLAHLANNCDTIILATKPNDIPAVISQLNSHLNGKNILFISIAAGITLHTLESLLPPTARVIRSMPNTPALVGMAATAYSPGAHATPADIDTTHTLLSAVGLALNLPEKHLDAVTGLSGSGPAYGFLIIEALADAGVKQGLPRAESLQLAAQTLLGAAAMVLQTNTHPAVLKDMVTSPGGTTIAGLAELEKNHLRHALISAVTAATLRSKELAKN